MDTFDRENKVVDDYTLVAEETSFAPEIVDVNVNTNDSQQERFITTREMPTVVKSAADGYYDRIESAYKIKIHGRFYNNFVVWDKNEKLRMVPDKFKGKYYTDGVLLLKQRGEGLLRLSRLQNDYGRRFPRENTRDTR